MRQQLTTGDVTLGCWPVVSLLTLPKCESDTPIWIPMAASTKLSPEQSTGPADLVTAARIEFCACLQLLAERARFTTGASWAAIAISEGSQFVYRAASGADSPEIGDAVQVRPEEFARSERHVQPGKPLTVAIIRDSKVEG